MIIVNPGVVMPARVALSIQRYDQKAQSLSDRIHAASYRCTDDLAGTQGQPVDGGNCRPSGAGRAGSVSANGKSKVGQTLEGGDRGLRCTASRINAAARPGWRDARNSAGERPPQGRAPALSCSTGEGCLRTSGGALHTGA